MMCVEQHLARDRVGIHLLGGAAGLNEDGQGDGDECHRECGLAHGRRVIREILARKGRGDREMARRGVISPTAISTIGRQTA